MRKISSCHSSTLHVAGLEEPAREQIEEPREESVIVETRESDVGRGVKTLEPDQWN